MNTNLYEILGLIAALRKFGQGLEQSVERVSSHIISGDWPFCGRHWSVEQDQAPHKQLRTFEIQRLQDTVISDLLKCHQAPKTDKSNCENWRKLTFDWSREYLYQHLLARHRSRVWIERVDWWRLLPEWYKVLGVWSQMTDICIDALIGMVLEPFPRANPVRPCQSRMQPDLYQ
jgi:hypothetical protein